MTKITYLIGAGASAEVIPVVSQMNKRIRNIINILKSYESPKEIERLDPDRFYALPENLKAINDTLLDVIKGFEWLLGEAENYFSIDTLARKYYLTNMENEYERLKKCLIIYFTLEQFICFPSDLEDNDYAFKKHAIAKRYDSFISVIASRGKQGLKLNGNVKIISWNYDLQFELSLKRYGDKKLHELKKRYQILPYLYHRRKENDLYKFDEFALIKLNGNAVFSVSAPRGEDYDTIFDRRTNTSIDMLLGIVLWELERFDFHDNSAARFFNFSWEGNEDTTARIHESYHTNIQEAEKIARETEVLVIIGYSFPIFNREIDNRLFEQMKKLRKVYIQDKDPDRIQSTIENAFSVFQNKIEKKVIKKLNTVHAREEIIEVPQVEILRETFTEQFVIPYELVTGG